MIVLPAIDLMAGAAVRLRRGDPAQRTVVGDDPIAVAKRWAGEGAEWLHVVDLDGALAGAPRHLDVLVSICRSVDIPVQVGGGLRTMKQLRDVFEAGASRAVIGTAAVTGTLLRPAMDTFGAQLAVALDVRDGFVSAAGWQETTRRSLVEVVADLACLGVARYVYTDINKDGMLEGPNIEGLRELLTLAAVPVIASGGMTTANDLRRTAAAGAEGAIVGRALYEGSLTLGEARAAAAAV